MEIIGRNIDEVLYKVSKELILAQEYSPRGQKTKELIQQTLIIENPDECIVKNPGRKLSLEYLESEIKWYMSGDLSVKKIEDSASLWKKIADENGNINSNYGHFTFKQKLDKFSGSQYDWVIDCLKKDKDSRQGIINFNQPTHKYIGNKDFPCTINTQYMIRNNKLIGITNMRSNDLIYGFCYDFPFFSLIQQKLTEELKNTYPNLELGANIHTASSLHVYEKHFKMIEEIIKNYDNQISDKIKLQW